jgi:hypothetical protein
MRNAVEFADAMGHSRKPLLYDLPLDISMNSRDDENEHRPDLSLLAGLYNDIRHSHFDTVLIGAVESCCVRLQMI